MASSNRRGSGWENTVRVGRSSSNSDSNRSVGFRAPLRSRSSRRSRSPNMVLNLFSRRSRRRRADSERSLQASSGDDIFVGPSVPAYVQNGTGWENVQPSHYAECKYMLPSAVTAGAHYPISNIPAQIYILQPQQLPMSAAGTESTAKATSGFSGCQPVEAQSTGSSQAPPGTVFTAFYPPGVQLGASAVPSVMSMPTQGFAAVAPAPGNMAAGTTDSQKEENAGHRRSSSRAAVEHDHSTHRQHPDRHRHRHFDNSSQERNVGHRRWKGDENDRGDKNEERRKHRSQPVPEKMHNKHICNGCGRVRSRKFHDANPIRPGKKAIPNFCRKCRDAFQMVNDAQEEEDALEIGRASYTDVSDLRICVVLLWSFLHMLILLQNKKVRNWLLPSETSFGRGPESTVCSVQDTLLF